MDLHTGGPEDGFELTCSRDEEVAHGKEFSCDGEVNLNFKKRPEYMKKLKKKIHRGSRDFQHDSHSKYIYRVIDKILPELYSLRNRFHRDDPYVKKTRA
jgi:ribosomal protein RSM22 (predicted rRNA methylase)